LLRHGTARRQVRRVEENGRDGWQVDDLWIPPTETGPAGFCVRWQFPPGTRLETDPASSLHFRGERQGVRFTVGLDAAWDKVAFYPETSGSLGFPVQGDLAGLVSPAFRRIEAGPAVVVTARGGNPAMYRTTFLADPA
jgi:hypothetical protein